MKILYITTIGSTMGFFQSVIRQCLDQGDCVDVMANESIKSVPEVYREWGCSIFPLSCKRTPFSVGNLTAIKQIKKITEQNHYDIVHCHTPVAAICTRIACIGARKRGTKVFYTSHGFHFYKGAPLKNWLLYYPAEWLCSFLTDLIITINQEDYQISKRLHAKAEVYVPGVGFDLDRFTDVSVDRQKLRAALGVSDNAFLLASVGEVNANKNHEVILRAMALLKDPNIHFMIAGSGDRQDYLLELAASLGIQHQFHLLGRRDDVPQLYAVSDACCFPSIREGLGLAALEGMASGLPLICADNRGTRSYARDEENAIVCPWNDPEAFARAIASLRDDSQRCRAFGKKGREIASNFSQDHVLAIMNEIYGSYAKMDFPKK